MRKITIPLAIFLLVVLDQWSKFWVVAHVPENGSQKFLPMIFSLTYVRNYGAAFSILQNQQWFFTLITVIVVGAAVCYLWKHLTGSNWLVSALTLIVAGGLGNFIDRLRLGYVVDMVNLDFMEFAIFNLADSCLSVGVFLLMIAFWKEEQHGSHH